MAQAATRVVRRIPSAALFTTGQYRKPQQVVAAYARVSTEKEEQEDSFERQVQHYTNLITSKSDWTFGGILQHLEERFQNVSEILRHLKWWALLRDPLVLY